VIDGFVLKFTDDLPPAGVIPRLEYSPQNFPDEWLDPERTPKLMINNG
jgi:hypothetical protein